MAGIDPAASRMQSARSTIWATSPWRCEQDLNLRVQSTFDFKSNSLTTRTSHLKLPCGIEPQTFRLQSERSTNWAIRAIKNYLIIT